MEMTPERWRATSEYLNVVFGDPGKDLGSTPRDAAIARTLLALPGQARDAGLPEIAISSDVGRLLSLLCMMASPVSGGARVLEIGTLGGYSALWICRGIGPSGRLITVESNPKHAQFARARFADAQVADQVELIEGLALDRVDGVAGGAVGSFDVVFLDADKRDYPELAKGLKGSLRVGGLLVADNALGSSRWWIDQYPDRAEFDSAEDHAMAVASREAADQFGRMMGKDEDFEVACVPIREGVLIARKRH